MTHAYFVRSTPKKSLVFFHTVHSRWYYEILKTFTRVFPQPKYSINILLASWGIYVQATYARKQRCSTANRHISMYGQLEHLSSRLHAAKSHSAPWSPGKSKESPFSHTHKAHQTKQAVILVSRLTKASVTTSSHANVVQSTQSLATSTASILLLKC